MALLAELLALTVELGMEVPQAVEKWGGGESVAKESKEMNKNAFSINLKQSKIN